MALKLPSALDVMAGKVRLPRPQSEPPATTAKANKLAIAREAIATPGDCSNPDCPYRDTVLKTRARTRLAVAKHRQRKAKP